MHQSSTLLAKTSVKVALALAAGAVILLAAFGTIKADGALQAGYYLPKCYLPCAQ